MVKIRVNVVVDYEIWEQLKQQGINMSKFVNEACKNYLDHDNSMVETDINDLRKKIEDLEVTKNKIVTEKLMLKSKLMEKEAVQMKEEQDKRDLELKRLEDNKKCKECNSIILPDHNVPFGDYMFCKRCFLAYGRPELAKKHGIAWKPRTLRGASDDSVPKV